MAGPNESWQYQGRQEHGWFGHGTGPSPVAAEQPGSGRFALTNREGRASSVAYGALAALPRNLRRGADHFDEFGYVERLQTLLVRWSGAARLSEAAFARHFFGRTADDPAVQALRAAAGAVATAKDSGDLREASEQVAEAMQEEGLGNWGRFLAGAQKRADDPATLAAVAASQPRPAPSAAKLLVTKVVDVAPPAATEPAHGRIWWWLHALGLTETRHEQATALRRVMGSQGGLVYTRDRAPQDVDQMSDDEVLALDRETRGQVHTPPWWVLQHRS